MVDKVLDKRWVIIVISDKIRIRLQKGKDIGNINSLIKGLEKLNERSCFADEVIELVLDGDGVLWQQLVKIELMEVELVFEALKDSKILNKQFLEGNAVRCEEGGR